MIRNLLVENSILIVLLLMKRITNINTEGYYNTSISYLYNHKALTLTPPSPLQLQMLSLESLILTLSHTQRKKEVHQLMVRKYCDAVCVFTWAALPGNFVCSVCCSVCCSMVYVL